MFLTIEAAPALAVCDQDNCFTKKSNSGHNSLDGRDEVSSRFDSNMLHIVLKLIMTRKIMSWRDIRKAIYSAARKTSPRQIKI